MAQIDPPVASHHSDTLAGHYHPYPEVARHAPDALQVTDLSFHHTFGTYKTFDASSTLSLAQIDLPATQI